MVRAALAALLGTEEDLEVVVTAPNGVVALEALGAHEVDVVVTDVEMPEMDGLALCQAIGTSYPKVRVVALSTFGRAGYLRRALASGAMGYLLKDAPAFALAAAIRAAHVGQRTIDPDLAAAACFDDPLTPREREVLRRAEVGETTERIASTLRLREGTVRNYLSSAIQKLDASNRTEAAALARARGWL